MPFTAAVVVPSSSATSAARQRSTSRRISTARCRAGRYCKAAAESGRNALGIRFTSVLPQLTPETDLGAAGVAAYAARQGVDIPAFLAGRAPAQARAEGGGSAPPLPARATRPA